MLSLGDAPFLHLALGVVLVVRWGVKNDTREQVKGKPRLPRAQRQKVHGHLSPVERKNIMAPATARKSSNSVLPVFFAMEPLIFGWA